MNPSETTEEERLSRVFGQSGPIPPTTFSVGPLPVAGRSSTSASGAQLAYPTSALERELCFNFVSRLDGAPRNATTTLYRDKFIHKYLSGMLVESKFDPMVYRLMLPPSLWTARKTNDKFGCLPGCLASSSKFQIWWAFVLDDLHNTAKVCLGEHQEDAHNEVILLMDAWTYLFTTLAREGDLCWESNAEKKWTLCANYALAAFYNFAKTGSLEHIGEHRYGNNWNRAEALMAIYPKQQAHEATGHNTPTSSTYSNNNKFQGKGPRQIPWNRDWLKAKGYEIPLKVFTCQRCKEYGYNESKCPCKDGFNPASSTNKRSKPAEGTSSDN
jgi:hypothetical protein